MAYLTKTIHDVVKYRDDANKAIALLKEKRSILWKCPELVATIDESVQPDQCGLINSINMAISELDCYVDLLDGIMCETQIYWPPTCIENKKS